MTIIDDIQFDDDDSDNTHAYDDDHSVLRLVTVVCWLEQTSSPVDFCPTLPSRDWGREGLRLSNRTWLADAPNLVGLSGRGFQSRAESLLH